MFDYEKAKKLAQTWIESNCSVEAVIVEKDTITKPYGWVFFYESKAFLATQKFSDRLLGNAPLLIDKIDGELRVLGTAQPVEVYLSEYEKTIPETRLKMSPKNLSNKL